MKDVWKEKKLGELCNIELGKTPSRSNSAFWDEKRQSGNVWLSIADLLITDNFIVSDSKEYLSKDGAAASKIVKKGTLLVSFKLTLGRLAFAGCDLFTNEAIAALTIFYEKNLTKEYLFYYLQFFDWIKAAENDVKLKGMTLNKAKLKEIQIRFPVISEQKCIVSLLDEAFSGLDAAIANTEKNLANVRELFDSYLNALFFHQKQGWKEMKLGDTKLLSIVDGDRGKNYPSKEDYLADGFCLFLNTKNVRPDGFDLRTLMFISKKKDESLGKGKLKRRDVVMTTRGTIGNIAIYDASVEFEEVRINSGMLIFRPDEKIILSEYLFEVLRSSIMKTQISKYVTGTAQPQLPIMTLINFVVPVPDSLEEQRKIVFTLHELEAETKRLEAIYRQKLNSLAELKQSLLHQAFTGQLTAKAMTEDVAA